MTDSIGSDEPSRQSPPRAATEGVDSATGVTEKKRGPPEDKPSSNTDNVDTEAGGNSAGSQQEEHPSKRARTEVGEQTTATVATDAPTDAQEGGGDTTEEDPQKDEDAAETPAKEEEDKAGKRKGLLWTEEEHKAFLRGLRKWGRGNWRLITRDFTPTRTPAQVASHAQKFFQRQLMIRRGHKLRPSIHDITDDYGEGPHGDNPVPYPYQPGWSTGDTGGQRYFHPQPVHQYPNPYDRDMAASSTRQGAMFDNSNPRGQYLPPSVPRPGQPGSGPGGQHERYLGLVPSHNQDRPFQPPQGGAGGPMQAPPYDQPQGGNAPPQPYAPVYDQQALLRRIQELESHNQQLLIENGKLRQQLMESSGNRGRWMTGTGSTQVAYPTWAPAAPAERRGPLPAMQPAPTYQAKTNYDNRGSQFVATEHFTQAPPMGSNIPRPQQDNTNTSQPPQDMRPQGQGSEPWPGRPSTR